MQSQRMLFIPIAKIANSHGKVLNDAGGKNIPQNLWGKTKELTHLVWMKFPAPLLELLFVESTLRLHRLDIGRKPHHSVRHALDF